MKKIISLLLIAFFSTAAKAQDLKVGIMAGPSENLMKVAAKIASEKYNFVIKPIVFTDYQFPNEALNNGDTDVNLFQTQEFLDAAVDAKKYKIEAVADAFIYPMGIYSKKVKNFSDLKKNAVIIIPSGSSNQSRALVLLQQAGVVTLKKPTSSSFFTPRDIQDNPKKLKVVAINPPQMPHYVADADLLVLNNDFVAPAGFQFKNSLFTERASDSTKPYINVVAARINAKQKETIQKFIEVIHTKEYELETYKYYPNAVKAWKAK